MVEVANRKSNMLSFDLADDELQLTVGLDFKRKAYTINRCKSPINFFR